jgi:NADPH:quinone reductase-like Zn-dependent oxidoreductase
MRGIEFSQFGLDQLRLTDRPEPVLKADEVLVRVRAVSLNYRDLLVVRGQYNPRMPLPRVPCSDAAGEVVAVGEEVRSVRIGDRVCGTFMQSWVDGPLSEAAAKSALGGALDGVLAEQLVFPEHGVIPFPKHLNFDEAACLPCAAVTAWNALTTHFDVRGKTVLVQGTGGVSIFALQIAKALGARVLLTSRDDDKLARAKALGADAVCNSRQQPDWAAWVREQSSGLGVDLVVEVGGAGTLEQSVKAVRHGGQIALIGVLAGGSGFNPIPMMMKGVTLRGIYVGSRAMFAEMNQLLAEKRIRPTIHQCFDLTETRAAFEHLQAAGHFGKVVVRVSESSGPS